MKILLKAAPWVFLVACIALFAPTADAAYQCTDKDRAEKLSIAPEQWRVLGEAYAAGMGHDLGYTMMAIAWQESRGGKYLMNVQTSDFGVMGSNLNTAAKRRGISGNFRKNMLAQQLVLDRQLGYSLALEELLFWKGVTGTWRDMVSGYNNGYAYNKGSVYLNKIVRNVNMFMHC